MLLRLLRYTKPAAEVPRQRLFKLFIITTLTRRVYDIPRATKRYSNLLFIPCCNIYIYFFFCVSCSLVDLLGDLYGGGGLLRVFFFPVLLDINIYYIRIITTENETAAVPVFRRGKRFIFFGTSRARSRQKTAEESPSCDATGMRERATILPLVCSRTRPKCTRFVHDH